MDNNIQNATKFTIRGGDGIYRSLYQIQGQKLIKGNMVDGIFEWIVESGGNVTHRTFISGGKITGLPNQF